MTEGIWQQGVSKFVLHDRRNLLESQRTPLLKAMENVSNNLVKFLRRESWRTSGMFGFIALSLILAAMIVDYAVLDTK
jgi:hypothetical protein